jgi:primosomal protein N''
MGMVWATVTFQHHSTYTAKYLEELRKGLWRLIRLKSKDKRGNGLAR